ncbi:MAG: (d)CMP kinase [Phycisphaerae bacterium]
MIITIDGPAGSGKSTAARNLARRLGAAYLDTGATYRAVALKALRDGLDLSDESAVAAAAQSADIHLCPEADGVRVWLDGREVSREIRSEEVSGAASTLAKSPQVRDVLVDLQRRIGRELGSFVAEGRDQGSVVFPDADVKFFVTASPEIRAERRYNELIEAGEQASYEKVLEGIIARDEADSKRDVAPLVKPDDAIEIDTSGNTVEQTLQQLMRHVEDAR